MKVRNLVEIKWYHILFGLLGLFAVLFVLAWILLSRTGPSYFIEDETDIVD